MNSSLHRASAFLFFLLGSMAIGCVILLRRGVAVDTLQPIANSIDLPLLLIGGIYAGSSLYHSIRRDKDFSLITALMIAFPLAVAFGVFAYINFFLPMAGSDVVPAGF